MKNLTSKKAVLVFGFLLLAITAIVFFVFSQNKNKPIPQPFLPETVLPLEHNNASLMKTDLELNLDLNKSDIFGKLFIALKPFPGQKETSILEMKISKGGEILNLKDLCSELDLSIPKEITGKMDGRYSLIGFFSKRENEEWELKSLGLVLAIKPAENKTAKESLREWEKTMIDNLYSLTLTQNTGNLSFGAREFQNGSYKKIDIRYSKLLFGLKKKSLSYIFTDDKIFITTSKETIYAVIKSLE